MILDDVKAYLVANSVDAGWLLGTGELPDDGDRAVVVYETPGWPADTLGRENERVGLMMRVRAARGEYQVGRLKWQEVFDLLNDAQQTATSPPLLVGYTFIRALNFGPLYFKDPEGRPNFTANFEVLKARTT